MKLSPLKLNSPHFAMMLVAFLVTILASVPSLAQSARGNIPQFAPASAWQVQSTTIGQVRGLQGVKLPCMMAASFDNGYVMRLSGGDNKMLAMAVDFRQDVFAQGRKYEASLMMGAGASQNITATAFSKSVLIFNLRPLSGFYQNLATAQNLQLDIEGNKMNFALGGVQGALGQLEQCYQGKAFGGQSQEVALTQGTPNNQTPAAAQAVTRAPSDWAQTPPPLPRAQMRQQRSSPIAEAEIWEAKAGDNLKDTLMMWAKRAGVALDWQAANTGMVANDMRVTGSFEDAVQSLMAQNAAALDIQAHLKEEGRPLVSPAMQPQSILPRTSAAPSAQGASNAGRWNAPAGSSLQQVLRQWSEQAGVNLIWQSNQAFRLKAPVNASGNYEAALQSVLEQFAQDRVRPAAQLNNDPVSGNRALFVEATRI